MKKILLATTAIVTMATVSGEAFAADKIALGLGGFMRHYVGIANHDEAAPGASMSLGQQSNTEIKVSGSTTLDNGLNVAATIELEGDRGASANAAAAAGGASTDQSFLTVSSDAMGAITLGAAPHAADDFAVGAPMVGPLDFNDGSDWANANAANTALASTYGVRDLGGNNLKMKYVSPSFSGVTVGISYDAAANVGTGNKRAAARNATDDSSSVAAMYEGEISGASVSADVARFHSNGAGNDYTNDRVGLSVGMAGFTVGGSYNNYNNAIVSTDGRAWEMGVSYETGPYAVSAAYVNSTSEVGAGVTDTKDTEWVLGASYDLGASVSLVGNYFSAKSTSAALASSNVSGLVAGIEVGF